MATDDAVGEAGWWIDDVFVRLGLPCAVIPTATATPTVGPPPTCQDCQCVAAPVCGDGTRDVSLGEACDGADAAACPGACRSDCTCPPEECRDAAETCAFQSDCCAPLLCLFGPDICFPPI